MFFQFPVAAVSNGLIYFFRKCVMNLEGVLRQGTFAQLKMDRMNSFIRKYRLTIDGRTDMYQLLGSCMWYTSDGRHIHDQALIRRIRAEAARRGSEVPAGSYLSPAGSSEPEGGVTSLLVSDQQEWDTRFAAQYGDAQIDGETVVYAEGLEDGTYRLIQLPVAGLVEKVRYRHVQSTASAVWQVQHNLGERLALNVLVMDDTENRVMCEVDFAASTENLLILRFGIPASGTAYVTLL
jgi:hypothetical protein